MIDRIHWSVEPFIDRDEQTNAASRLQRISHIAEGVHIILNMFEDVQTNGCVQIPISKLKKCFGANIQMVSFKWLVGESFARHSQFLRYHVQADDQLSIDVELRDVPNGATDIKDSAANIWRDL